MAHEKNHDYHILNPSIWPFLSAVGAFILLLGSVFYFFITIHQLFFSLDCFWQFIVCTDGGQM